MESVRIRLLFADNISELTTEQLKCLILVPRCECPSVKTVKAYIQNRFKIEAKRKLRLSLDGYDLPDWESSLIIRDNDSVSVHLDDGVIRPLQETEPKGKKRKKTNGEDTLELEINITKKDKRESGADKKKKSKDKTRKWTDKMLVKNKTEGTGVETSKKFKESPVENCKKKSKVTNMSPDCTNQLDFEKLKAVQSSVLPHSQQSGKKKKRKRRPKKKSTVKNPPGDSKDKNVISVNIESVNGMEGSTMVTKCNGDDPRYENRQKCENDQYNNMPNGTSVGHVYFGSDNEKNDGMQFSGNPEVNNSLLENVADAKDGRLDPKYEDDNQDLEQDGPTPIDGSKQCLHISNSSKAPVKDYSTFPPLNGAPRIGDVIAFKTLELTSSYCPEVSEFKEGIVTMYDHTNQQVGLQLTCLPQTLHKNEDQAVGRFEMQLDDDWTTYSEQQQQNTLITIAVASLMETKLLST